MKIAQLTGSPVCLPEAPLKEALDYWNDLGIRNFEVFTGFTKAAFDLAADDPETYREAARERLMKLTSMHLPAVREDDPGSLEQAISAVEVARRLGCSVVIVKARTLPAYAAHAGGIVEACVEAGLVPAITNHAGTAITTTADVVSVLETVNHEQLGTVLEVGHIHAAGESWRQLLDATASRIRLVHLKDIANRESVPYGRGEVDFTELFSTLDAQGYTGQYVIEHEMGDRRSGAIDATRYLKALVNEMNSHEEC